MSPFSSSNGLRVSVWKRSDRLSKDFFRQGVPIANYYSLIQINKIIKSLHIPSSKYLHPGLIS